MIIEKSLSLSVVLFLLQTSAKVMVITAVITMPISALFMISKRPVYDFEILLQSLLFCGIMVSKNMTRIGNIVMVTEVVAALVWRDDKFMICQRPAHKARGLLWEFVGGKVELGETKEQALIRECREELAVTISVGDVFMDVTHEYPDLTVHLTLFNATISGGKPQRLEHNDIKWITPSEIPNYEFCPADVEILKKIIEVHL